MHLVIVESPAKSRTINKYLGKDYTVLASFGHIRDLPAKDGSVRPDEDFAMTYTVSDDSKKRVTEIAKAAKGADSIILATDPDREGEAISWHVLEVLREKKALKKDVAVQRVVFNEITKRAVLEGMNNPRELDMDLINAQQARRALDYLVGFTLSPVLWRKLPGSRSAGRVQSVALRLICEREAEIEAFRTQEYWSIHGQFLTPEKKQFDARLTHYDGEKLDKLSIGNEGDATRIADSLKGKSYSVTSLESKQARRNPPPPFITSTLQQEASRKLGFGARKTMQVAQKLYEGIDLGGETIGLITYMRTDGVTVSQEAIAQTRDMIGKRFGAPYVPDRPRAYTSKAKNAQEAHEAIRPTDLTRTPESIASHLDRDQLRLYELIWKRMVASQMASAVLDQVVAEIEPQGMKATFRANGSVIAFDGFYTLYREGRDDDKDEDGDRRLPAMKEKDPLEASEISSEQHFTEPPPRYSEASLVKKLEELGIGRPSTYASIISVLQDRDYVRLDKKRFFPEERGRLVTAFLESFFRRYVEYDFTANLENELDSISAGKLAWKDVLRGFWDAFYSQTQQVSEKKTSEVLDMLGQVLEEHIFPPREDGSDPRACPDCADGRLSLKLGRYGAFLGCSNYPDCRYTRQLDTMKSGDDAGNEGDSNGEYPRVLGVDPKTSQEISLRKGPYGVYLQRDDGNKKPPRISIPKGMDPATITLEMAITLLALPREVGTHPESSKLISAGIGRYGPYLLHDGQYISLETVEDVLTIGINRAVEIIAAKGKKGRAAAEPLRVLGPHPEDGKDIAVYDGRYGPYVKHGKVNASLPKDAGVDEVTVEQAVELLAARAAKGGKTKKRSKKAS